MKSINSRQIKEDKEIKEIAETIQKAFKKFLKADPEFEPPDIFPPPVLFDLIFDDDIFSPSSLFDPLFNDDQNDDFSGGDGL